MFVTLSELLLCETIGDNVDLQNNDNWQIISVEVEFFACFPSAFQAFVCLSWAKNDREPNRILCKILVSCHPVDYFRVLKCHSLGWRQKIASKKIKDISSTNGQRWNPKLNLSFRLNKQSDATQSWTRKFSSSIHRHLSYK